MSDEFLFRNATTRDTDEVYEICLKTGDAGEDATAIFQHPELLGHIYAGPYLRFPDRFALVIEDNEGIAGYLLAVPDSRQFETWAEQNWWPELRRHYPSTNELTREAALIRQIHHPNIASERFVGEYPAHMHIDLLPRVQGKGLGRRLMRMLALDLESKNVAGLHLGVSAQNTRASQFYRRLGFQLLEATEFGEILGLKFPATI
ncbi:MAG: GNAT family N-acetyltransferase [Cryobacterium sp.]|nr:GNAT family N-acetyltransferase [Cryobacterium sp.]MBX3103609.1 GNAT family N-acetyltransferase [Cryobacterium sp.]